MQAYREVINSKKLNNIVNLPEEMRDSEVEIIVLKISDKNRKKEEKKLTQNWAGAMSNFRHQYTSLELQKKALEWRGESTT